MENVIKQIRTFKNLKTSLFDILMLVSIYLIPTVSHLFALPIYFIEPMRLALILAIAHTTKKNAYLLATTLPIFSTIVSNHPSVIKSGIIAFELILNVWFFYALVKILKNNLTAMISAIVLSKLCYYAIKYTLISLALMNSTLVSTPIFIQIATTLVFSIYAFLMLNNKRT